MNRSQSSLRAFISEANQIDPRGQFPTINTLGYTPYKRKIRIQINVLRPHKQDKKKQRCQVSHTLEA